MKNGKRLTVANHKYLQSMNLKSENWLISKRTSNSWTLIHRETGRVRQIPAP
ncbi:hypothetical protein MKZ08_08310 [Viridibacillus sp. FSL R5-0477]|uniref:DUF6906 family protein n=1 Tax=Viridibacillus TaxID=496496 RepID=UPI0013DE6596|nr:hypothetical protein [Viridibacillus arenosi]